MSRRHQQTCQIAQFLNVFGDSWMLLILREAFLGETRFSAFQRNTGISKNLLSERLSTLVEEGILERDDVGATGPRYAYRLTRKGYELAPILVAIVQWGDKHLFGEGNEPLRLVEKTDRRPIAKLNLTNMDDTQLHWRNIMALPGPGANEAMRLRFKATKQTAQSR